MALHLKCELEEAGWAILTIGNGSEEIRLQLSYMADPIKEFARTACALLAGAASQRVGFYHEPGETDLVLVRVRGAALRYTLRRPVFRSLGGIDLRMLFSRNSVLLRGTTTPRAFALVMHENLARLLATHGYEGYEENWLEPFPRDDFERLETALAALKTPETETGGPR